MSPTVNQLASRKQQKAATRAALKEAARSCFSEKGFAATQVADVSRTAGVAHGTFYVHFASKEALLDELLAEFNDSLVRSLRLLSTEGDLRSVLEGATAIFLDHWTTHRAFVEAYVQRLSAGISLDGLRVGINPPVQDFVALRLSAAGVAERTARLAAQGLLALWMRIGLQFLYGHVSRDEATQTLTLLTLGAVGALARRAISDREPA
jgi:AcrR family transcriptional regulator